MTATDRNVIAELTVRTITVDAPVEPLRFARAHGFAWSDDERTIVTSGVATEVATNDPARALSVLRTLGAEGDTPVLAVGALGYDLARPLVVPEVTLQIVGGRAQVTTVTADDPDTVIERFFAEPRASDAPRRFDVRDDRSPDTWAAGVARVLHAVDTGSVDKVVLARQVFVVADAPFRLAEILDRLLREHGGCFVFADRGFVGASPELLVARHGRTLTSRPMAGTVARSGVPEIDERRADALRASGKDAREHQYVARAVRDALGPFCAELDVPEVPELRRFTNVSHLVTPICGTLRDSTDALTLTRALHPTPAVHGVPFASAAELLTDIEGFNRGPYAGPVGWLDANGDGVFAVGLRSALLDDAHATLWAGAGIVDGSDAAREWQETQAKFEPMLRALVRP